MSDTLTTIEGAAGAAQFIGTNLARFYGGEMGRAAATFLLGEASWTASATDLVAKLQDGTASGEDVADVCNRTAQTLAGFGVLAGLANPAFVTATGAAAGVLFVYKTFVPEETKQAMWDNVFSSIFESYSVGSKPLPWADMMETDPNWSPRRIGYPTNTAYLAARAFLRKDPLALDLDGDGIETRGATGDAVTLFDYNADGIRTGTGWIAPDDGLVVMDRNGNGTIDSGAELFGVDTVRADGSNATDGFNALADLDSNHDGLFNASDAAFGQVRIWQDANSDGISQSAELKTLAQQGIKAIRLAATASGQILPTQNQIAYTGLFDKTNGTTGTAYAVSRG